MQSDIDLLEPARSCSANADLASAPTKNLPTSDQTGTASTFTTTAIPEPSTYVAALGLLALMLWPLRRRLIKNAKSILGLRPPMRDKLAGKA
jgi:hypothetical protein